MLTADKLKELWAATQANGRTLEACPGPHVFVDATPEKYIDKTWRCSICGGTINASAYYWYVRGIAHGRAAGATAARAEMPKEKP